MELFKKCNFLILILQIELLSASYEIILRCNVHAT